MRTLPQSCNDCQKGLRQELMNSESVMRVYTIYDYVSDSEIRTSTVFYNKFDVVMSLT